MASNNNNAEPKQPGLVEGHVEYVKGAAQSAVGAVTGSHAWTKSGDQAKAYGVSAMKAAGEKRDPASQGFGGVEALAGKAVGCEGMQKEGEASRKE